MKSNKEIRKDIMTILGILNEYTVDIADLSDDINPEEDAVIELIKAYEAYEQAKVHLIKAKKMIKA